MLVENTNEPLFKKDEISAQIIRSTIEFYKIITEKLMPLPKTSHYIFNLRDFSRVIKGICLFNNLDSIESIKRLWLHEVKIF